MTEKERTRKLIQESFEEFLKDGKSIKHYEREEIRTIPTQKVTYEFKETYYDAEGFRKEVEFGYTEPEDFSIYTGGM